jgi:hypothetical protein
VTVTTSERPTLPAALYATACSLWWPFVLRVTSHTNATLALLNRATVVPSTTNSVRAMPDLSEASMLIAIGPKPLGGAPSLTLGRALFATTTTRRDEMTRPSPRIPRASTLCRPFRVVSVFQRVVQRGVVHVLTFVPSTSSSTRTTLLPRATLAMSTVPAARDGAVTLIDTPDCAKATDELRSEPINDAEMTR